MNAARQNKVDQIVIAELDANEEESLDEFEKLGEGSDEGGISEENLEEFTHGLQEKQAKRAEEVEKRERLESAKRKKQEEL